MVGRMVLRHALIAFACAPLIAMGCTSKHTPDDPYDVHREHPVTAKPTLIEPPTTPRDAVVDTLHGVEVADPYRWLENIADPRVSAWVDDQDAFARPLIDGVAGRERLVSRFTELFYMDAVSAPYHRGNHWFWTRRFKDREKSVVFVREGEAGAERVLLDPNKWSTDGSAALGGWTPSWDGRFVAYKVKENNADEAVIKVRDVAADKDLDEVIDGAKYAGIAWSADAKGFYYVYLPPAGPGVAVDARPGFAEIRWHELGSDPTGDQQVFPPTGDPQTFIGVDVSRDGNWMFLTVQRGWNQTEVWFRDLRKMVKADVTPAPADFDTAKRIAWHAERRGFAPLAVGLDALTSVSAHKNVFYAITNDGAPRYRVFRIDPKRTKRSQWKEIIPESEGTLESVEIAGEHLLVSKLINAASRLEVRKLNGKLVREVVLPGIGSVTGTVGEPSDDTAYFTFTSFTQPPETYKTSISKGSVEVWSKVEIPVDTSRFEVQQVFYPSKDGTKVSMFIVHKKGLVKDGSHPTMLYGYGGFNVNMTPSYASSVAVWLELGGVYAMPNLRGGGEYGEDWHKDGMLLKKQNVFDDFISAAEYLVSQGFTKPERLAIRGGSNGGLLVGAAMTQRPDLFRAVICAVPLLDMVRYHLFGSGRTWIPEYGSADDAEQFKTLFGYSPYHRVVRGTRYPALLMMAADSDDRVDPLHARKFAALIQWANEGVDDPRPALFRVERNAGHGGGDLVKQSVQTFADQFAFLAWQLGMDIPGAYPGAAKP